MTEPTLDTLTRRLDRLEREARWWKIIGSTAVAVVDLVVFLGATPTTRVADEVRAKRFVLVDTGGKERGRLSTQPDGWTELLLFDGEGKSFARLTESFLAVWDKDDSASVSPSMVSLRQMATDRGKSVALSATYLSHRGADGKFNWLDDHSLSVRGLNHGRVSLGLLDEVPFLHVIRDGYGIALSAKGAESASITIVGSAGRAMLGAGAVKDVRTGVVEQRPVSSLVLFDKNGGVIWKAP